MSTIKLAAKQLRKSLPRAKAPLTFKPQLQVVVEAESSVIEIPLTHVFVNVAGTGKRQVLKVREISAYRIENGALVIEVRE